ncbi:hypothetical protein ASE63_22260 [Bosea sp. Root381]|uniref:hypothetical protein n=1 Tax=Bosea sp. Root381 TaxID=1736524 RepID=UPI0006F32F24|nr:hypothetical protein [Bosea sp. Root381]KRE07426.1 hypothetical protein ASE63_22260 [Bosea sp. Root381]
METRTLWIPERSDRLALLIAQKVQDGTVPCLAQYLDEDRAKASAETLAKVHRDPDYKARCVVIEWRAVDDGYIAVPRIVERLGSLAAMLFIVIGGPFAVGWGTLL